MNPRKVTALTGRIDREFRAVPSKSATHRALVAAALARGSSTILGPLDARDTRVTRDGLVALGIPVEPVDGGWRVHGGGGSVPGGGRLLCEESGTSARFLLALAAIGARPSTLDGAPRLRRRPMRDLVEALIALGARIDPAPDGAELPLTAGGSRLRGGSVRVASGRSSQFASALLLIGSSLPRGLDLTLVPPAVSLPYVDLTAAVLDAFGARPQRDGPLRWIVRPGLHDGRSYRVEGDHSSASYLLAAAAVAGGRVRVTGLDTSSSQPDARFGRILSEAGCDVRSGNDWVEVRSTGRLRGFDVDLTEAPDLAPTLAAVGLFVDRASVIRGVAHLRAKESDRLEMLATNLTALGRPSVAVEDRLEIGSPADALRPATIRTGSDHRIAMAFAVAGLGLDGLVIDDAACVAKSNPEFWGQLDALGR